MVRWRLSSHSWYLLADFVVNSWRCRVACDLKCAVHWVAVDTGRIDWLRFPHLSVEWQWKTSSLRHQILSPAGFLSSVADRHN